MNAAYTMQDLMRYRLEQLPFLSGLEKGFGTVRMDMTGGSLIVTAGGRDYKVAFQVVETEMERAERIRLEAQMRLAMLYEAPPVIVPRTGG